MNRLKAIAKGEDKLMREINDLLDSGQNLPTATRGNIDSKLENTLLSRTSWKRWVINPKDQYLFLLRD